MIPRSSNAPHTLKAVVICGEHDHDRVLFAFHAGLHDPVAIIDSAVTSTVADVSSLSQWIRIAQFQLNDGGRY